jgi:hypothetical protein
MDKDKILEKFKKDEYLVINEEYSKLIAILTSPALYAEEELLISKLRTMFLDVKRAAMNDFDKILKSITIK